MNAILNPGLASVLQDFDSDRETARKRAVRATQRIVGVAFGALAVFLAWVIVADARDLASGAEARLVRIDPSELERTDPQQEAIWHETDNGLFHRHRKVSRSAPLQLRRGVPVVVADAQPDETAPFVGRIVDDRRARDARILRVKADPRVEGIIPFPEIYRDPAGNGSERANRAKPRSRGSDKPGSTHANCN